jgi:ferrochelatase
VKIAIILFNLGGPDSLEAMQPFLRNLFGDPAILRVPAGRASTRTPASPLCSARRSMDAGGWRRSAAAAM